MDTKKLLIQTAYISLIVQLITGGIGSVGLFLELKPEDRILKDILRLETIVQFIEFIFYYWLVNNLSNIPENVTLIRYIDWNITTPLMLVSTAMFMKYNTMKENEKKIETKDFIEHEKEKVYQIVIYNFAMLLFGLLGELGYLSKYISFPLGFIFFYLSFQVLENNYIGDNTTNLYLYKFLFGVWALYGVAALLNFELKNTCYNVLDIFSKNFYGLFIFYVIYQTKMNY
jgi:bacteriorhodopsin